METTRVSTKGQIVIPKQVRKALHWGAGKELVVVQTEDGVLLKAASGGPTVAVEAAYASLRSAARNQPPTEEQMRAAVREKAAQRFKRSGHK
jgi:AbrB family looped-hinge helix DNA binding protein